MFRVLYWVAEEIQADGSSQVTGVYTSIPDLVRHGIRTQGGRQLRLTLTKLDANRGALGTWLSPEFSGLAETLESCVRTDEFSEEQAKALVQALDELYLSAAR